MLLPARGNKIRWANLLPLVVREVLKILRFDRQPPPVCPSISWHHNLQMPTAASCRFQVLLLHNASNNTTSLLNERLYACCVVADLQTCGCRIKKLPFYLSEEGKCFVAYKRQPARSKAFLRQ